MSNSFLFGAGASYYGLPVVKDIPQSYTRFLSRVKDLITDHYGKIDLQLTEKKHSELAEYWQVRFLKYLEKFEKGVHNHASVDTYAKKMYLIKDPDLRYYKFCLAAFFTFEQIRRGIDPRYDIFFASILDHSVEKFPTNLNILSWNYDTQFEMSYSNFSGKEMIEDAKKSLSIVTNAEIQKSKAYSKKFHIIKLNGSTETYVPRERDSAIYFKSLDYHSKKDLDFHALTLIGYAMESFVLRPNSRTSLSFAWEKGDRNNASTLRAAISSTAQTIKLIVIGYSFPYFNRKIDGEIFDKMANLKKVYIQDPNAELLVPKVKELCHRVPRDSDFEIIPFQEVDQFLIPDELIY